MAGHTGPAEATGALRESFICPARPKMASWRSRLTNRRTSFIFASRTIQPAQSRPGRSSRSWVAYAQEHKAILLYDAAYEGYISDPRDSALDFRNSGRDSNARSSFAVSPRPADSPGCAADSRSCRKRSLRADDRRPRNAVASALASALEHESQRRELSGAARRGSALQREGRAQVRGLVDHYMGNARILSGGARVAPACESMAERMRLTFGSRRRLA